VTLGREGREANWREGGLRGEAREAATSHERGRGEGGCQEGLGRVEGRADVEKQGRRHSHPGGGGEGEECA
jgi:hypothetical protein